MSLDFINAYKKAETYKNASGEFEFDDQVAESGDVLKWYKLAEAYLEFSEGDPNDLIRNDAEELYNYIIDVDTSTTQVLKALAYSDIKEKITDKKVEVQIALPLFLFPILMEPGSRLL